MIGKFLRISVLALLLFGISACSDGRYLSEPSDAPLPDPISNQKIDKETISNPQTEAQNQNQSKTNDTISTPTSGQDTQAIPVLYYHSVMREDGNEVRMPPDLFNDQMAYLQANGYHSISLNQLNQALYQGGSLPSKPVVITFDDGYADNYTTAFPIIRKYGFTAAVFMVSGYIDGKGFLSSSELQELSANGWEIEGHTKNHPALSKLDSTTVINELKDSKEQIESKLGQPVEFFAYPYGEFNDSVVQAVKNTGYLMAFTTERGWASRETDAWHVHRVYCYASMGLDEYARRLQNPKY